MGSIAVSEEHEHASNASRKSDIHPQQSQHQHHLSKSHHLIETSSSSPSVDASKLTLKIKNLSINGFLSQDSQVANFRNIPYAKIPGRWRQAVALDPTKEAGSIDATQWGARCPQPVDVLHDATRHLYPRMSTFDRQSEFECLNLNVYGPRDVVAIATGERRKTRGLPVLVWIHGGAFVFGDGGCEFDGQYLVRHSIERGQPIVVVGFNYRLGVLGFLSSQQLREEARANGEAGFNNLGFHDQVIALQWIQKHVHFFGGDGARLTVAGESAGACSIVAHLNGRTPLFQNAFLMSPAAISPGPLRDGQEAYDRLVASAGLTDAPASKQLSALRSMSPLEIHGRIADRNSLVVQDDEFFADWTGRRFEAISPLPSWTKAVVAGCTKDENVLFAQKWAVMSSAQLYEAWTAIYDDDKVYAKEVFAAYGGGGDGGSGSDITETSSHQDLVAALIAYTGDVLFGKVTHTLATAHLQQPHPDNPKVYLYTFDQPDTLSKNDIFRGGAYHSQDNAFLFCHPQVAGPGAPAEFRATADVYSAAVLKLAYGREPWEDIGVAGRFMSIWADRSGMREGSEGVSKRWMGLVQTEERLDMFMRGKALLYDAMAYAMSLPVDVHRQLE